MRLLVSCSKIMIWPRLSTQQTVNKCVVWSVSIGNIKLQLQHSFNDLCLVGVGMSIMPLSLRWITRILVERDWQNGCARELGRLQELAPAKRPCVPSCIHMRESNPRRRCALSHSSGRRACLLQVISWKLVCLQGDSFSFSTRHRVIQ